MTDGICTYCLIGVTASLSHYVRNTTWQGKPDQSIALSAGPRAIAAWHDAVMTVTGGNALFSSGAIDDTLTAFAVLEGTPVCIGHLWEKLGTPYADKRGVRR